MKNLTNLPPTKILLLDDQILILKGFSDMLKGMCPDSSVKFYTSVERVKEALAAEKYDFLFSDFMMPGVNTTEFINYCKTNYPNLIIIIFSGIQEIKVIKELLAMGVNGFISKKVTHHEVKQALETTYRSETFVSANLCEKLALTAINKERLPPFEN